jgi:crotonobetaine/carnitine-CoA ligase
MTANVSATIYDRRIPAPEDCITRLLIDRRARETPDKVFSLFPDASSWTYRQLRDAVVRTALGLQRLGVKQGDRVLCWMPNGSDAVRTLFAANYLGAVAIPVNIAYRGRLLEHVLRNSEARLIVLHADLQPRLADIDCAALTQAVVLGGTPVAHARLRVHGSDALSPAPGNLEPLERPIAPWDTQMVIYTSGTTGPSKGVLTSYIHLHTAGIASFSYLTADDRYLINLPLFHVGGMGVMNYILILGASAALVESFETAKFWSVVRATQSTSTTLLGVMATFLVKQPPADTDRGHGLRSVIMVPLAEDSKDFARRFGCDVYTVFNMTEISSPLFAGPNPGPLTSCGQPRPGVEIRLVDENDCEVAPGGVGEMILRTDLPWAMNHGYLGNPEATARAWRNGWFHTGDAFRIDEYGNFFFVDRMKDAIRRRGENISSFEVEMEVCAHPAVKEAAAVAVPSEHGEDEVLVAISLAPGAELDPADLIGFLIPRMAHFMVPRYVRIVELLPRTPTQKVEKHLIRAEGIVEGTFDRVKAGINVKRERIGAAKSA